MESAVKLGELAEKLSAEGIGLATVRSLLASNPDVFAYHERRWIPASRLMGEGRPLTEAIALTLHNFGGPMPLDLLVAEIARIRGEELERVEVTVGRTLKSDPEFILTDEGTVALMNWSFRGDDQSIARTFALNGIELEPVEAAANALGKFDWLEKGSVAKALQKLAPISLKVLGAVAWTTLNSQDPKSTLIFDEREFANAAFTAKGFVYGSDGTMHADADAKKWIATAVKLADKLAPTVEVDDAAPIELKTEDVDALVAKILKGDGTTTAIKLLEENFEITPGTKTFPDDLANIVEALRSDDKVVWVGGDRFRKSGTIPDYIAEVPEPFVFVDTTNENEDGELVDVELTDDGLSTSLRKLLAHPLAMDVLDEDIAPTPKQQPDTIRLVLKSIHRELGTFPMCQIPTGFLDSDPKVQELIVVDSATGRELQIWANHDARLLYNWIEWWLEQPVESGAVFTLTKTVKPNVFEFGWMEQPDPVVYIASQRMEELRQIGAESEGKSTLDLLIEIMAHWPKGADYLTLLAEVNVVRRSSRRLIASLLSSYQCFYQRSGSPVWHFDAKKVELGFDKTKRKFVRK